MSSGGGDEIEQIMSEIQNLQTSAPAPAQSALDPQGEVEKLIENRDAAPAVSAEPPAEVSHAAPVPAPTPASVAISSNTEVEKEFQKSADDASLEDTLGDLKPEMEEEEKPMAEVIPIRKSGAPGGTQDEGTLSMSLTGSMNMKLQFDSGEHSVVVGFGDGYFQVSLQDGSEFRIPLKKTEKASSKKAI